MKQINWKAFFLAVGGAFVAGAGSAFGMAVDGMTVLEIPRLKAAGVAALSAGASLAWPVALGFFIPGYKKKP
jgi:hypothetical protein